MGLRMGKAASSCEVCHRQLQAYFDLGELPATNLNVQNPPVFHARILCCKHCLHLELEEKVDKTILFPKEYPHFSGQTERMRKNFFELFRDTTPFLSPTSRILDVGSNDGSLLENYYRNGYDCIGIDPTDTRIAAEKKGIPCIDAFFSKFLGRRLKRNKQQFDLVLATNVFSHVDDLSDAFEGIEQVLSDTGIIVCEFQWLKELIRQNQYDAFYLEHLRYLSLRSLSKMAQRFGLVAFRAKKIQTHGGSLRVYLGRPQYWEREASVDSLLEAESALLTGDRFTAFSENAKACQRALSTLLYSMRDAGKTVYAIGAPVRGSTLLHSSQIDYPTIACALELAQSPKIGRVIPGTQIPIHNECYLLETPPDCVLLLSWHLKDELMEKYRLQGFRGSFLVPFPEPYLLPPDVPLNSKEFACNPEECQIPH